MTQSRPDQELLALEMFGFFARARSVPGTNRTSRDVRSLVAIGGKADMAVTSADFRVGPEADISELLLIVPDHASIAANVNDNCVFPLPAALSPRATAS
jgi:hypothetical protein